MKTKKETETLAVCPVCGKKEKKFLFENTDRLHGIPGEFGLNQCMSCSAFYLSPRPTLKALPHYYPDDYVAYQINEQACVQSEAMRRSRNFLRNTILYEVYRYKDFGNEPRIRPSLIARPIAYLLFPLWKRSYYSLPKINFPKYVSRGKALDIGCGSGYYIWILRNLGWEVYGVEPSENAANKGREKFGLDIRTGTLFDHKFPDNYFHFITMTHVLEHIHNPVETMKEVKRILHPDGELIIRTPNMGSLGYKRFGKNWGPLETPRHLILYSYKSLSALSDLAGLQIRKLITVHEKVRLYWSLEYEEKAAKGTGDFGIKERYTLIQNLKANLIDAHESVLIGIGRNAGEELQAVLAKKGNLH